MRKLVVLLVLVGIMLSMAGVALAAWTVDGWLRPRLDTINEAVEVATGWDCRVVIVETDDYLAAGLFCQK